MKDIKYLTSIRGLACIIVVLAHLFGSIPNYGLYLSGCGKIGVWLFFILSAYLLTKQFEEKREKIYVFYLKRFFRIFPCYIIILLICYFIKYIDLNTLEKSLILIEGYGHFWTIPVEFSFYIIFPIIMLLITKLKDNRIKIIGLSIFTIFFAILFPYTSYEENSINLKWYICIFLTGMNLYYIQTYIKKSNNIIFDIIILISFIIILLLTPFIRYKLIDITPTPYLQNKYLYLTFIWSIIFVSIYKSKYFINVLDKSKMLLFIGNISYSLYLIHYILIFCIKLNNDFIRIAIVMILSVLLSIILNKFIEKPFIDLNKEIISKIYKKEKGD